VYYDLEVHSLEIKNQPKFKPINQKVDVPTYTGKDINDHIFYEVIYFMGKEDEVDHEIY
jgi:hypothetical protein